MAPHTTRRDTRTWTDRERQRENDRERERDTVTARKIHTGDGDKQAGTTHTWRQIRSTINTNGEILTVGQENKRAHVTTNERREKKRVQTPGGNDEVRHTSLMPANSSNNFLVLISKGDGEMRSWL